MYSGFVNYRQLPRNAQLRILFSLMGISSLLAIAIPTLASQFGDRNETTHLGAESALPSPTSALDSPEPSESPTMLTGNEPTTTKPEPTVTESPSPNSQSGSPTPRPWPSVLPPNLQKYWLGIPSTVLIDPRAQTVYFPEIELSGTTSTLVCISSDYGQIDINRRNVVDDSPTGVLRISGDTSNFVMVSGPANLIASAINGNGGLALFSYSRPISKIVLTFRIVGVTDPVLNPTFCAGASFENTKRSRIKALGINLDTKKGSIPLRSPASGG